MKKIFALLVLVSCIFFAPLQFTTDSAEAAAKTMYVNAKGDIILRETPAKDGVRMGTIKNKVAIKVLSSSKGWSKVDTGKKVGYVYTSALSAKNPNAKKSEPKKNNAAKSTASTVNSGLMPKAGLTLTYNPAMASGEMGKFKVKTENKQRVLVNVNDEKGELDFVYSEANNRISFRIKGEEWSYFSFALPFKQGQSTTRYLEMEGEEGLWLETDKVFIESTNSKLTTKAGTFNNVVVIRTEDNYKYYIAKDYGLIKFVSDTGEVISELTSIK